MTRWENLSYTIRKRCGARTKIPCTLSPIFKNLGNDQLKRAGENGADARLTKSDNRTSCRTEIMNSSIHGTEHPVVFTNGGMQIMGVLHRPPSEAPPPGVLFFHGCTGSRTEAHWLFVKIARYFATRGIMSLRFDFRNSGESEGRFEDMTISGEVSDALRAFGFLTEECGADPERIGLLGLSMGGAVAAITAGRLRGRVKSCVLLNPVARPLDDLNFLAQTREVNVSGFPIEYNAFLFGQAFIEELPVIRPLEEITSATCPVLVINGTADRTIHPRRSREYHDTLRRAGIRTELAVLEGADHTFASAAWEREVAKKAGEWFGETL